MHHQSPQGFIKEHFHRFLRLFLLHWKSFNDCSSVSFKFSFRNYSKDSIRNSYRCFYTSSSNGFFWNSIKGSSRIPSWIPSEIHTRIYSRIFSKKYFRNLSVYSFIISSKYYIILGIPTKLPSEIVPKMYPWTSSRNLVKSSFKYSFRNSSTNSFQNFLQLLFRPFGREGALLSRNIRFFRYFCPPCFGHSYQRLYREFLKCLLQQLLFEFLNYSFTVSGTGFPKFLLGLLQKFLQTLLRSSFKDKRLEITTQYCPTISDAQISKSEILTIV